MNRKFVWKPTPGVKTQWPAVHTVERFSEATEVAEHWKLPWLGIVKKSLPTVRQGLVVRTETLSAKRRYQRVDERRVAHRRNDGGVPLPAWVSGPPAEVPSSRAASSGERDRFVALSPARLDDQRWTGEILPSPSKGRAAPRVAGSAGATRRSLDAAARRRAAVQ
jgi:hypothetical protein